MANERQTPASAPAAATAVPTTPVSNTESLLAATLAQLAESNRQNAESNKRIAELMERQATYNEQALKIAPRRRKTLDEYLKEKPRKRLLHEVFQNGRPVNPAGLSTTTIKKLDGLAAGTYADGLVDVIRIKVGPGGINTRIHIVYNNKHDNQRMQINMRFPTFTALVNGIAQEMALNGVAPVEDVVADPIEEPLLEVTPVLKPEINQQ